MITKIVIKRQIKKGQEMQFFSLLKRLRSLAIQQDGYISGETLMSSQNANKILVISKWESMDAWYKWTENNERNQIDLQLSELQENQTVYEPYVFGRYKSDSE